MRTIGNAVMTAVCGTALMLMALPGISAAAEHGGMGGMQQGGMGGMQQGGMGGMQQGSSGDHGGMKMDGHGKKAPGGHDMMKMGNKVFSGKIGPWEGTARIVDMKAHMEASGMKAMGAMPNSHHVAFDLSDAKTKAHVAEGKGTVTVTGPDKKTTTSEFMVMQGHFGADVNLPKPGKYTFQAEIESGGRKGSTTFSYTLK